MVDSSVEPHGEPAIRVMMMPRDTNPSGTIFGGVILSYIDQAGGIEAHKLSPHRLVTVAMDSVQFKEPVYVGDMLSFYAKVVSIGRTSVRIRVDVEATRYREPQVRVPVTTAEIIYVAVDENQRPIPVRSVPPASST
ncbi:MAG TPA: acyl-CoA thioesterase [Phycisphaerae bacterium]|nr:acyl-CoA thioesterase [Phycisphaerae bacterium]